jgi:hypothetical protein
MSRHLVLLLLAGCVLLAPQPAVAQPKEERKQTIIPADGTDVLQFLLDRAGIKPIKKAELWSLGRMDDVIVIVLGDPDLITAGRQPHALAANVASSGGGVLIASDSSTRLVHDLGDIHIPGTVAGGPKTRRESLFLGRDNLPFVVPRRRPLGNPDTYWDLFEGLTRIATNKPAYIQLNVGRSVTPLASYSEDCVVNPTNGRVRNVDAGRDFFAVSVGGLGPTLILADPSIFLNQMMLATDPAGTRTDNLEFAARVVNYLSHEDGRPKRKRCVFFQNGEVVERFDTLRNAMQPPLPLPNLWAMQPKITDLADKLVDDVQTKDIPNRLLGEQESTRNDRFRGIMVYVLALLTIRAAWYLLRRLWAVKRPADGPPAPPGGLPVTDRGEKPVGVFDRRQRELLRRNNLYEPVHAAVREMFLAAGAPPDAGAKLPRVRIDSIVTRPDTLKEALQELWRIGFGPPRVVTVNRWRQLEPLFERVRQAHADGKWSFEAPRHRG